MTSPFNIRERNEHQHRARSVANDVFPVGKAVVVRIHPTLETLVENRPSIHLRYYPQSAPGHSSRRVSGRLPGVVQRFTPLALRLPALFRGRRDRFLGLNSFGPFEAARTLIPRIKFCQEPSRGIAQTLKSFSSACLHARNKAWRRKHGVQRNAASGA